MAAAIGTLPQNGVPQPGDTVYIQGHGPGKLIDTAASLRGSKKFKVEYPDGTCFHVARDQIMAHQSIPSSSPPGSPMMNRRRSMIASPVASSGPRRLEYLGRAFDDVARSTRSPAAIFGLVATMTGGGVLSLPYAMSQCGLVLGSIALILSGIAAAWSVDMLVECARCTGRDTFELVGHAAFGESSRKLTMFLVFLLCWLASVGYYVLLGDLLVPCLDSFFGGLEHVDSELLRRLTLISATLLLAPMCFKSNLNALRFMCFLSVGSVFIVAVVLAMRAWPVFDEEHSVTIIVADESRQAFVSGKLDLWPADWYQAWYSLPTFAVSFMCQFNALPTHQELARPTIWRMRRINAVTISLTTCLYLIFGTFGYIYAGSCTCGNVLLNFGNHDSAVIVARLCLSAVIMLNMPLLIQPSRNSLFRLLSGMGLFANAQPSLGTSQSGLQIGGSDGPHLEVVRERSGENLSAASLPNSPSAEDTSVCMVGTNFDDSPSSTPNTTNARPLLEAAAPPPITATAVAPTAVRQSPRTLTDRQVSNGSNGSAPPSPFKSTPGQSPDTSPRAGGLSRSSSEDVARVHVYAAEDTRHSRDHRLGLAPMDTFLPKDDTVQASAIQPTVCQRSTLTAILIFTSLLLACLLKSVMVVWSILGSTICFMVGFIMPAAFWCKIVGPHVSTWRYASAVGLIVVSVVLAVSCTILTMTKLGQPPCPVPAVSVNTLLEL